MIEKVLAAVAGTFFIFSAGCASNEQRPPTTYRVEPGPPSQYPATVYQQQPGVVSGESTLTNAPGASLIPHEAIQVPVSAPIQQAPVVQQTVPPQQTQPPPTQQPAPPPQQTVVVQQQPPPVRVEVIPVAPAPGYVWVNGYWGWHGSWVWVPGRWAHPPRPHAVWVGGAWVHGRHGWSWHAGHWR